MIARIAGPIESGYATSTTSIATTTVAQNAMPGFLLSVIVRFAGIPETATEATILAGAIVNSACDPSGVGMILNATFRGVVRPRRTRPPADGFDPVGGRYAVTRQYHVQAPSASSTTPAATNP